MGNGVFYFQTRPSPLPWKTGPSPMQNLEVDKPCWPCCPLWQVKSRGRGDPRDALNNSATSTSRSEGAYEGLSTCCPLLGEAPLEPNKAHRNSATFCQEAAQVRAVGMWAGQVQPVVVIRVQGDDLTWPMSTLQQRRLFSGVYPFRFPHRRSLEKTSASRSVVLATWQTGRRWLDI